MRGKKKLRKGPQAAKRTRLTLRDLAEHAGVSPATVSLVLRQSPLVAKTTRERVLKSVDTLGYIYNRGAASLRTKRTHTVGISINDLTNPYFAGLTAAIERALTVLGRTVFLSNAEENPERQGSFIATMREYNADGIVICPAEGTDAAALARVAQGTPCVQISRWVKGADMDYVGSDNRRGTYLATEHLIGLGHRRIAMIGGTATTSTGIERRDGFRKALTAHGLARDDDLDVACPATRVNGADVITRLLERPDPPTAAVCFNDVIAFGVMLGLRRLGIEPGRDFAVVGCDDVAEAALWTPALTTIAIDFVAMGEAAAKLMLERIAAPDAMRRRVVVQPRLVVRESSGPPVRAVSHHTR